MQQNWPEGKMKKKVDKNRKTTERYIDEIYSILNHCTVGQKSLYFNAAEINACIVRLMSSRPGMF